MGQKIVLGLVAVGSVLVLNVLGFTVSVNAEDNLNNLATATEIVGEQPLLTVDDTEMLARPSVVISQVSTRSAQSAEHELIELYNNSAEPVDVTDWCVTLFNSRTGSQLACLRSSGIGYRLRLPVGERIVLVSKSLAAADVRLSGFATFTNGSITESGGAVILQNARGEEVDALSWRADMPVEGEPMRGLSVSSPVLERKILNADGLLQDTNSNTHDFFISSLRAAYHSYLFSPEVFDYCLNVPQIQTVLPTGLYRDELTGECNEIAPPIVNDCAGVIISEIAANTDRQFVELYNQSGDAISIGGCILMTNRSQTARYVLPEMHLGPNSYRVIYINETDLTLTKTTSGTAYLLSPDGATEAASVSYANLKPATTWAWFGGEDWRQTFLSTPGEANQYEQYLPCESGYVRSEETGRCRTVVESVKDRECSEGKVLNEQTNRCKNASNTGSTPAPCRDGQYRHPETNRCRNVATSEREQVPCKTGQYRHPETGRCRNLVVGAGSLTPCKAGQERNPDTNRCRKIAGASDKLKPCKANQERNPDTNRCRNVVKTGAIPTAAFAAVPVNDTPEAIAGWWMLGGVGLLATGYAGWEWRREAYAAVRRVATIFTSSR